jgi:hypothetical protein
MPVPHFPAEIPGPLASPEDCAPDWWIMPPKNEIERLFRRLKGFRRIFSRFEKLDVLFLGFLTFTLIVEALR